MFAIKMALIGKMPHPQFLFCDAARLQVKITNSLPVHIFHPTLTEPELGSCGDPWGYIFPRKMHFMLTEHFCCLTNRGKYASKNSGINVPRSRLKLTWPLSVIALELLNSLGAAVSVFLPEVKMPFLAESLLSRSSFVVCD